MLSWFRVFCRHGPLRKQALRSRANSNNGLRDVGKLNVDISVILIILTVIPGHTVHVHTHNVRVQTHGMQNQTPTVYVHCHAVRTHTHTVHIHGHTYHTLRKMALSRKTIVLCWQNDVVS